jgi:chloride channel 3/4/5
MRLAGYQPLSPRSGRHQEEEIFALTHDGLPVPHRRRGGKYEDGSTIDWLHEESEERERNQVLRSQYGIRGLLLPLLDAARMWFVVVATGIGIGIAGAWLDVLVKW